MTTDAESGNVRDRLRVPLSRLTTRVDEAQLAFETTREVSPLEGAIGQERALEALAFGLGVDSPGFNVYVAGQPGSGRMTTVTSYLGREAAKRPVPNDWVYVYNFQDPMKPRGVSLPPGYGRRFAEDVREMVAELRTRLPRAFESPDYQERVEAALESVHRRHTGAHRGDGRGGAAARRGACPDRGRDHRDAPRAERRADDPGGGRPAAPRGGRAVAAGTAGGPGVRHRSRCRAASAGAGGGPSPPAGQPRRRQLRHATAVRRAAREVRDGGAGGGRTPRRPEGGHAPQPAAVPPARAGRPGRAAGPLRRRRGGRRRPGPLPGQRVHRPLTGLGRAGRIRGHAHLQQRFWQSPAPPPPGRDERRFHDGPPRRYPPGERRVPGAPGKGRARIPVRLASAEGGAEEQAGRDREPRRTVLVSPSLHDRTGADTARRQGRADWQPAARAYVDAPRRGLPQAVQGQSRLRLRGRTEAGEHHQARSVRGGPSPRARPPALRRRGRGAAHRAVVPPRRRPREAHYPLRRCRRPRDGGVVLGRGPPAATSSVETMSSPPQARAGGGRTSSRTGSRSSSKMGQSAST